MKITRRAALKGLALGPLVTALPNLAFADVDTDRRLAVVFLRGGADGLTLAPAYGDPDFLAVRGVLADDLPGSGGRFEMLDLDGFFAFNPDLKRMHAMYRDEDALLIHATTTGYRERSHFDAQDALDRGSVDKGVDSGWLNRALSVMPGQFGVGREQLALGLGPNLPLSLRGPVPVGNWSPPVAPNLTEDTMERLARLFDQDALLGSALEKARSAASMAGAMGGGSNTGLFQTLSAAAGSFLAQKNGPRIATIDYGGWDSHSDQNRRNVPGPENAYYAGRFPEMYLALDAGLQALKEELGKAWSKTAVLIVTEFGRTVHVNGTDGTDHGTGGAALLLGGAVAGGRVIADWPGLKPRDLYEARDLYPTTDIRSIMKGLLHDHLGLDEGVLEGRVFPDSRRTKPLGGLVRT